MNSTFDTIVEELNERFKATRPDRTPEETEENVIGLHHQGAITTARELNRHQASLFVLFHQYQKHHWLVEGPQFRDLHLFMEECYKEIHKDLDAIAERITVLGAIPSASLNQLAEDAYLKHEQEGYFNTRSMLRHDLEGEKIICTMLRRTITSAQERSDYGTATLLKQILMRSEDRAHHLDHYLADDGLLPVQE